MSDVIILLNVELRAIAEMVAEELRNEGIEAHIKSRTFFGGAYLTEGGGDGWLVIVPSDEAEQAREIIAQLEEAGEEFTEYIEAE